MSKQNLLLIVIGVLFVILGYFVYKSNKSVSDVSKYDLRVHALEREKDSLKTLILGFERRIAELNAATDSARAARIEIKKEYIYITRDYETVYNIIDTASFRSAKRFWADRYR